MTKREWTYQDKRVVAAILAGSVNSANLQRIMARFGISRNAAVGISYRVLYPSKYGPKEHWKSKQGQLQAEAKRLAARVKRIAIRRPDGHLRDPLTEHEKRFASFTYNRGETPAQIGRLLNIDGRLVFGYLQAKPGYADGRVLIRGEASRARSKRLCKHCKAKPVAFGRHYYCSEACLWEHDRIATKTGRRGARSRKRMREYRVRKKADAAFEARRREANKRWRDSERGRYLMKLSRMARREAEARGITRADVYREWKVETVRHDRTW